MVFISANIAGGTLSDSSCGRGVIAVDASDELSDRYPVGSAETNRQTAENGPPQAVVIAVEIAV
ncbi:hypothetical protein [Natrialba sp. PRR66]|uniref:hypothetical protein n=1 Tax=Natrialba sp. PRR66 TaxID=3098146 RepID=UPI002B1E5D2E|nr:hypothetical protein [Natrialba sp. PRR66]